jgi:hypothetical protein
VRSRPRTMPRGNRNVLRVVLVARRIIAVRKEIAHAFAAREPILIKGAMASTSGMYTCSTNFLRAPFTSVLRNVDALRIDHGEAGSFGSIAVVMPPTRNVCGCGFLPPSTAWMRMKSFCQASASR